MRSNPSTAAGGYGCVWSASASEIASASSSRSDGKSCRTLTPSAATLAARTSARLCAMRRRPSRPRYARLIVETARPWRDALSALAYSMRAILARIWRCILMMADASVRMRRTRRRPNMPRAPPSITVAARLYTPRSRLT